MSFEKMFKQKKYGNIVVNDKIEENIIDDLNEKNKIDESKVYNVLKEDIKEDNKTRIDDIFSKLGNSIKTSINENINKESNKPVINENINKESKHAYDKFFKSKTKTDNYNNAPASASYIGEYVGDINNLSVGTIYKKRGSVYLKSENNIHENLTQPPQVSGGGLGERDVRSIVNTAINTLDSAHINSANSGIEFTGGFAGKLLSNNFAWQPGTGISITQADVGSGIYKTFSLDRDVHLAVDVPYWSDPVPADHTDKGVFGGSYLPDNVPTVFDYVTVDSDTYEDGSNVITTGGLDMSNFKVGDTIRARFDFNAIPQISNTTIEPAIWYKNRDSNNNVTFTFPLTSQPIFFGTGTVGKTLLNRVDISVYIASQEDINALAQFSIKSDNQIIIQPLSCLLTLIR